MLVVRALHLLFWGGCFHFLCLARHFSTRHLFFGSDHGFRETSGRRLLLVVEGSVGGEFCSQLCGADCDLGHDVLVADVEVPHSGVDAGNAAAGLVVAW